MDFQTFGDDNWEVKKWLNSAFAEVPKDKRDGHAATLLTKLQLVSQDIARSIEEAAEQGTAVVPRVSRELEATRQEAAFLKRHMENVKIGLENVESKTNNSIQVLLSIDQVKERVEQSEKALKKVDNWAQLVLEAEQSFHEQDINSIASKIGQLDSSILIFQGAPDFAEKTKLLNQFKNRLEAILSSKVITAVQTGAVEAAQQMYAHFDAIDRLDQFKSYYIKTTRAQVKMAWEERDEHERIGALFELLENQFKTHYSFVQAVFNGGKHGDIVLELYASILNNLPIKETVKHLIDLDQPRDAFVLLSTSRAMCANFMKSVRDNVKDQAPTRKCVETFVQAIWAPFGQSIINYEVLLNKMLLAKVSDFRLDGDMLSLAEHISQASTSLRDLHTEVMAFSADITGDFGLHMTQLALNEAHAKLAERTMAAISDAQRGTSGNEFDKFASGLSVLDHVGPWFAELTQLNEAFSARLRAMAHYSSAAMMAKATDEWEFNIFQFCAPSKFGQLQTLIDQAINDRGLLDASTESFAKVAQQITDLTFSSFFGSIEDSLVQLCCADACTRGDAPLPACGYSPSEMITKVGDSLLTLPQYLDPLSGDNIKLALLHTKLSFLTEQLPDEETSDDELFERNHGASAWLCAAGNGACKVFIKSILAIDELSDWGRLQMVCDLQYLESVSDSLGVDITDEWRDLLTLLNAESEQLPQVAADLPRAMADRVLRMRKALH